MKPKEKEMENKVFRIQTICQLHEIGGFDKPKHPLVSIIDYSKIKVSETPSSGRFACSFYSINFKKGVF